MLFWNTQDTTKNTHNALSQIKPYFTFLLVFTYVTIMIYAILFYMNAGVVEGNLLMIPSTIASLAALISFWVTYKKKRQNKPN